MTDQANEHLPRLDPGSYRGQAYVHWIMTIQDRRTGWLIPAFNYKFRELLTHAAFRYAVACPVYCLMPDHIHMMWMGIDDRTDQLKASKYFRKQVSIALSKLGFEFQHQPYDHVLREDERQESAFENTVEYIATKGYVIHATESTSLLMSTCIANSRGIGLLTRRVCEF